MAGRRGGAAYIADSPLLVGVMWLRMELSLSVAIIAEHIRSRRMTGDEKNAEERKKW